MRPAVCRLAQAARLVGFVRNDSEGVWIEVEGPPSVVAEFAQAVADGAPPLARISSMEVTSLEPRGELDFRVAETESGHRTSANIPADAGICDACLAELFDPADRRYRYAFINCTDCGPRLTIVREVPYDRAKTTMSSFAMCASCEAEYHDPLGRRFHAEPNACPECGPRVALYADGALLARGDAAIVDAQGRLKGGAVVAVKGLGGYQLAALATDAVVIGRLRAAKRRPHKPFAVMARSLDAIARFAQVGAPARQMLASPARPIVLLPILPDARVAPNVAPGLAEIGVMLPSTPLHYLLLERLDAPLVMTSGNAADEPIAIDEPSAFAALSGIADAFLCHDRPIHARADDSVLRPIGRAAQCVRRSRGFVPDPVRLGFEGPSVLAVGGHLKNTVCLTRGTEAFLSQHIGDLHTPEARAFFEESIAKLGRLLGVEPTLVAHDFHPEYASTDWALASFRDRVAVQHHHAHVASCLAEHARSEAVIGVVFDGTGYGPDGDLWGGEFLVADLRSFRRAGHLRPLPLAGGEAAIREPWRLAVAALLDAGESPEPFVTGVSASRARVEAVVRLLEGRVAAPRATGAGRWFDAIAALAGVCDAITYEGQAAIELEALAVGLPGASAYPFEIDSGTGAGPFVVDLRPTVRAVAADLRRGVERAWIAAQFHATLAGAVVDGCRRVRVAAPLDTVVLSGGCFQNRLLVEQARASLEAQGFHVLTHQRVPPNDGGLALGQAAVAVCRFSTLGIGSAL